MNHIGTNNPYPNAPEQDELTRLRAELEAVTNDRHAIESRLAGYIERETALQRENEELKAQQGAIVGYIHDSGLITADDKDYHAGNRYPLVRLNHPASLSEDAKDTSN